MSTPAPEALEEGSRTLVRVFLFGMPEWAIYTLAGLVILYVMCAIGVFVGRTGRSPLWGLLAVVPVLWPPLIGLTALLFWWIAFRPWTLPPYLQEAAEGDGAEDDARAPSGASSSSD